jgi:predicted HicB family RNase H-like nuclease
MSLLQYNGYVGTVEYSAEDHCLFGKLAYIRDLVTYEATTARALEKAFREAVDDYVALCVRQKREPNVPFKGSFNVRVGPELHRLASIAAGEKSLNTFVSEAIREKVERVSESRSSR